MVEQKCNLNCCKATFCPLKPAWARSIHTTQSLQAGPTKNDKQCDFQLIIGDPGSMDFEKITPGLLQIIWKSHCLSFFVGPACRLCVV